MEPKNDYLNVLAEFCTPTTREVIGGKSKISYARFYEAKHDSIELLEIKKVIFNKQVTVVFWEDGTKTVVKCLPKDVFDPEKAIAMAVCKRFFGNSSKYYDHIKKWIYNENSYPNQIETSLGTDKITFNYSIITGKTRLHQLYFKVCFDDDEKRELRLVYPNRVLSPENGIVEIFNVGSRKWQRIRLPKNTKRRLILLYKESKKKK